MLKIELCAGAVEPNAQGCTFAHPLFEPQVKKMKVLRTHFFGLKVVLRTQFWIASTAPVNGKHSRGKKIHPLLKSYEVK